MNIPINSAPCINGPAVMLAVDDIHINPIVSGNYQAALLNAGGQIVYGPQRLQMTDAQFAAYGSDDSIVGTYAAAAFGVTLAPAAPAPAQPKAPAPTTA